MSSSSMRTCRLSTCANSMSAVNGLAPLMIPPLRPSDAAEGTYRTFGSPSCCPSLIELRKSAAAAARCSCASAMCAKCAKNVLVSVSPADEVGADDKDDDDLVERSFHTGSGGDGSADGRTISARLNERRTKARKSRGRNASVCSSLGSNSELK